ncbi:phosphatase PAP2 family protein [Actinoplanes sp. N902-109]|uniref:phosphatase PAP2 family protein n=1 Tax=Actinoplanes sp. (strain N902-109) TaxID=649831 RepID=UPI0003295F96|nr:phosphatase PAP2 family protein [Actinoplanes sp. N902-109]AGL18706.1 phosphoesterase PA-phosphatase-like protein [Actinoplanes sp. N902-109]
MTALASPPRDTTAVRDGGRGISHVFAHAFVAVLAAAGVAALYYLFVRTSQGQVFDTRAMRGADVSHPRAVEVMQRALNGTTLVSLVAICVAAAAIGFVRRRADLAIAAALLVLGANASARLLKTYLVRPDLDGTSMSNSFPSGHTTAAASVAAALILTLPFAIRGTVAMIGAAYTTLIAIATVWAEWHRPSDTMAALLVVLAWSALASAIVRLRRVRITGVTARPNRLAMLLFAVVGTVSAIVAVAGGTAFEYAGNLAPQLTGGRAAFVTGIAAVTTVVSATFAIWVRLAAGDRPSPTPGGDK